MRVDSMHDTAFKMVYTAVFVTIQLMPPAALPGANLLKRLINRF